VLPLWTWAIGSCSLVLAGQSLIFVGLRRFDRRPASLGLAVIAPALYVAGVVPTGLWEEQGPRAALFSGVFALVSFACAYQLQSGAAVEPLASRRPVALAFVALGVVYAARFVVASTGQGTYGWIAFVFLVQIFNVFVFAVGLFALIKERTELALRQAAHTDQLTGVGNRHSFFELAHKPLDGTLLLLDLDHFKRINDRFGHAVGDDVLARCAAVITTNLRKVDVFARIGGEEFALFLPGCDRTAATAVAERLRHAILGLTLHAEGHHHQPDDQHRNCGEPAEPEPARRPAERRRHRALQGEGTRAEPRRSRRRGRGGVAGREPRRLTVSGALRRTRATAPPASLSRIPP
jgi:GGDEF domain-containing protein